MKTVKEKFKEFRMRRAYLKFTADIGVVLEKLFDRFWWYSLVHEKNTAISNAYHNLCSDTIIKEDYNILDAFCDAIFKYCSFIARYFIFFKFIRRVDEKELLVTYYGMLSSLKTEDNKYLYIPQRKDWKKIRKEKDCYVLDNFLSFTDFIYALFMYYIITFTFLWHIDFIKKIFIQYIPTPFILPLNMYDLCKKDLYRSFAGDVLIEGLFYDRIFNRLSKKIKNKDKLEKKIIYVFEGRSWEKALCYYFNKSGRFVEKIGIVCSAVSDNNLQFFYHYLDVDRMPLPELIGVPGEILKEKLGKVYDDASVFILGNDRLFLRGVPSFDKIDKKILLVLGANDKQNLDLLDFVKSSMSGNIVVKKHPDSKLTDEEIGFKIEDNIILSDKKAVIAVSSTVTLDAISFGIPIIAPKLKHYVDFIPIPDTYKANKFCYRIDEGFDLMLAIDKIEETELDFNICMEYINKYFNYKSREEMRQIIDSI